MWKLYLGVILFAGPHLYSMFMPRNRASVITSYGEGAYKGLYSVSVLAGLVLLAMAYLDGRSGPNSLAMFYEPWANARHAMLILVFLGFILIFANQSKGYISKYARQPFSLGVVLWSLGHLLVNGERAVVVIFGMLLVLAVLDIVVSEARHKRPTHAPNGLHDLRAVVVGIALYFVFALGFHPYVLNIPVLG